MKTINLFKKWPLILSVLAVSALVASCDKDDDDVDEQKYTLSGTASGSQEVPAVATSATGTLTGTYDAGNNKFDYTINWSGLSGTVAAMHIHGPAMAGANASVIHPLSITVNGAMGSSSGSLTLADSTETHLLNGRLYYNIHTALHPNGEIRSQIVTAPQ
jgi:hypothetical protein